MKEKYIAGRRLQSENIQGYLFILPQMLGIILFR